MGQGVVVEVAGEAVEQLGGCCEVQLVAFARAALGEQGAGLADTWHQLALALVQLPGELCGIGVAQRASVPAGE
ncbi:hypothetical protein D3C80_1650990 [compost metagenome]